MCRPRLRHTECAYYFGNSDAMLWYHYLTLFAVAFLAGAVNSVAGGGTLLTFPSLMWVAKAAQIVDFAKVANATSTVALWPAALSSFWGYRGQMPSDRRETMLLAAPSFVGGTIGAILLTMTDDAAFEHLVPWLILTATLLFVAQAPLAKLRQHWAERTRAESTPPLRGESATESRGTVCSLDDPGYGAPEVKTTSARWTAVVLLQFFVGIYGGYFGAGIGILMLAAFGWLGFTNIHHMNALKNLIGACINGIAAAIFIAQGLVHWPLALWMAAGSILGGLAGAGLAQRIGQAWVRRTVIAVGFAATAWTLYNLEHGANA